MNAASSEIFAGRLIRDGACDGAFNMAADAFLATAAGNSGLPVLRLYRWRVPTLSLGYHQEIGGKVLDKCAGMDVPVVRRPTGGRAVLHDNELTYCWVLPASHPAFSRHRDDLLKSVAEVFVCAARSLHLDAELVRVTGADFNLPSGTRKASPLCFDAVSRWEVRLNGRKWIGSAQRFSTAGLLQHGSILLGASSLDAGELFGVRCASRPGFGLNIDAEKLADSIIEAFSRLHRVVWKPQAWSAGEMRTVRSMMEDYSILPAPDALPESCGGGADHRTEKHQSWS